jgi:hypothetical protein
MSTPAHPIPTKPKPKPPTQDPRCAATALGLPQRLRQLIALLGR